MTALESFIEKYAYPFGKELGDNGEGLPNLEFISDLNNLIAEEVNGKACSSDCDVLQKELKKKEIEIERLRTLINKIVDVSRISTKEMLDTIYLQRQQLGG